MTVPLRHARLYAGHPRLFSAARTARTPGIATPFLEARITLLPGHDENFRQYKG
jgi:hypothetical protein